MITATPPAEKTFSAHRLQSFHGMGHVFTHVAARQRGYSKNYKQFKETYLPQITKFVSTNPMIPPNEWKNAVREITLRYPELIDPDNSETNKLWPWFGDLVVYVDKEGIEHNVRKPTTFMKYMKRTNKDRILSSCCRKKRDSHNVYK